jgi:transcriptional regulator with XRE-family HTH domain
MRHAAENRRQVAKEVPGLRAARKRVFISQRALEKQSGVSYVNISRIENGQAAMPDTIDKLARALGVEADELLGLPGGLPPKESNMTALVRSLALEPEPYFTEISIGNRRVGDLYEATYVRLLLAERRAREGLFDVEPFDTELTNYVRRLLAAARRLPQRGDRRELRRRVAKMAHRAAAVLEQEADRLEREVGDRRDQARQIEIEGLELTGPE